MRLTWTDNATDETGYHLDRATDENFTQNLITQDLPTSPNAFTDTASGLARAERSTIGCAYNSAGDSDNSNTASVTIPLAPPKPSDQQVTDVTTTTIDMSWQDNAGHDADGYKILRAENHGAFTPGRKSSADLANPAEHLRMVGYEPDAWHISRVPHHRL